ncbi:MAG: hypothetical protein P1U46_01690 [Patescibacteria group bacterium]|nr:hypothetical protein [Patescibacteria group bacterium]
MKSFIPEVFQVRACHQLSKDKAQLNNQASELSQEISKLETS